MELSDIVESGDIVALQSAMSNDFTEAEVARALSIAITHEQLDAVKLLVRYVDNIDAPLALGRNALILGAEVGNVEIIRFLLEHGADVNAHDSYGDTPLHVAIDADIEAAIAQSEYSGDDIQFSTDIIELLIERGADLNARTAQGKTPLDWAKRGHIPAQVLIISQLRRQRLARS